VRAVSASGESRRAGGSLPPPAVAPDVYDESYYRDWCGDTDAWTPDGSGPIAGVYQFAADQLGIVGGTTLLDVGCGRGELLVVAAERGARAIGVEYSTDALRLARQTLDGYGQTAELVQADARRIPVPDATADHAALLDVVEHLTPQELAQSLGEIRRILKPGGRLLIHTYPNRLIYSVTYRLLRASWPPRWWRWPADPRVDLERAMHVNEMTYRSLRRALVDAGFPEVRVWRGDVVYTGHLPNEEGARVYRRLARTRGLRGLALANLFAMATR
jgi:ubiquinone/menaquinone biosynthesis C-methylase UbiE